jgi:hypothetical protein
MVNMLSVMTQATHRIRVICLSVVAALFFGSASPAWAQEESDYKDPTIVDEESTSAPDGVKDLGKGSKPEKKPILNPIYNEWWFWAAAVAAAGVLGTLAIVPLQKRAPTCAGNAYTAGCIGDGR